MASHFINLTLLPDSAQRLSNLCGRLNEHIQQIELGLQLKIRQRGNIFQLNGDEQAVASGCELLEMLYRATENEKLLSPNQIHLAMQEFLNNESAETESDRAAEPSALISTPKAASNPAANISGIMLGTSGGTTSILVSGPPALVRPISRLPAQLRHSSKKESTAFCWSGQP